ncbi:ATP synthase subunit I [Aestuariibacter halophilus]|uniref:ATP synthase subunit I n=1 Tax=Fluctibacter halophilus TaxID=226011 RepID=A0ABS8GA07_9ALTE|nr:ATP synthase subunit I [Aestuariibacter halophilus]MCC2616941.1 ATP synthase subunit I [Aestuariibacter halophilus]
MTENGRKLVRKVVWVQSGVVVACALVTTLMMEATTGLSVFYGGLIGILPFVLFARFAFRYAGGRSNQKVVRSFSQGAKLKLLTSMILFVVAFAVLNAQPLPVLAGYAATLIAQWGAMLANSSTPD